MNDDDELYDEEAVLDPRTKALMDKQKELESDMSNAADLFGTGSSGTPHSFPFTLVGISVI